VDNVALVLEVYERAARREYVQDLFHEDIEWVMPHPGGELLRGRAELRDWWRDYESTWENRVVVVEQILELDDERVLVFFTESAVGRASGVETAASPAAIWTIRDGKVARFHAWIDREEALREAGLKEPPPPPAG
jgi:ketosteroid isomerase-like protein